MIKNYDGVLDSEAIFDLKLEDSVLLNNFRRSIEDSQAYWNKAKGFNLDSVRAENRRLWLGKHYNDYELYDHQTPYVDNRIFISVESSIAYISAKVASPEVYPAQSTDVSKYLAQDLEKALKAHAEEDNINKKAKRVARHAFLNHIGYLKLRYDIDEDCIVSEVIDPEAIVIDQNAKEGDNPRFIAEYIDASVEELIHKFPAKKQAIMNANGYKVGTALQLQKRVQYIEIYFTYYEGGSKCEGVAWFYGTVVLGKMKNPNWVYKNKKEIESNYTEYPPKPYIQINFFNDGLSYIDPTGGIQQASSVQYSLNKRGRQIIDSADQANSGWVFSSKGLTKQDAEQLIGAPNEKIIVDAEDVRTAVQRFPAAVLPAFVVQDKFDHRTEIDTIMGTPSIFRGDSTKNATLGQDVIAKEQSQMRQDVFVDAIDDFMHRYYRLVTQMMKVYYDEDHWYKINGKDGLFDSVVMKADKIEDGIDVRVTAGSATAVDKDRIQTTALTLAKLGMTDPLSLYEDLGLPEANDRLSRLVQYKVDPTALLETVKNEEFDQQAFMNITVLNAGKMAEPEENISQEHVDFHRKYMITSEFLGLDDKIKQLHIDHVTLETEALRQLLLLEQTQMPTPQDMQQQMPPQDGMQQGPGQAPPQGPPQGMPQGMPQMPPEPDMSQGMPQGMVPPTSNPSNPSLGSTPPMV